MRFLKEMWRASPEESFWRLKRRLVEDARMPCTDYRKVKVVFVLSTGRVGTQSMANILSFAKTYRVYHEPRPALFTLSRAIYESTISPSNGAIASEAFKFSRLNQLEYAFRDGRGYIETSPQATFLAEIIDMVLPESKFIHLIRNPYDVVRSGIRRNWYGGVAEDKTRIAPRRGSEFEPHWANMSSFEKNVWLWRETNEWIGNFLDSLPVERKLFLKHEDLFSVDGKGLPSLFDFIGSETPAPKTVRKLLSRKLNAQESGEFPRVNEWTPQMKSSVRKVAGATATRFGYEMLD